jgi:predicted  nucleic acid-binding Zn-ribbon protein
MSPDQKSSPESEAEYQRFKDKTAEIESRMSEQIRAMTQRYERDMEIATKKLHRSKWSAIAALSIAVILAGVAGTLTVNQVDHLVANLSESVREAEQQRNQLDASIALLDRHTQKINMIATKLDAVSVNMKNGFRTTDMMVKTEVAPLSERMGTLETKTDGLTKKTVDLKTEFKSLREAVVNSELKRLNETLTKLKGVANRLSGKDLHSLRGTIKQLSLKLDELEKEIPLKALKKDLDILRRLIGDLNQQVDDLGGNKRPLKGPLEGRIRSDQE